MRSSLDPQNGVLEVEFDTDRELESYLETASQRGLFLIRLSETPGIGERLLVRLRSAGDRREVPVEVQQIFRSGAARHGVALRVLEPETLSPGGGAAGRARGRPQSGRSKPAEAEDRGVAETGAATDAVAIRRMNVTQRMRLAMRAGRIERQILLRDSSPQVLMGLLTNPRIDDQEVLELVRSPHAASGVLQHVAKDRRWSSNHEVRLALVKNPKTPTPLAQRLLPTLRRHDLRVLAKSDHVREAIKSAALRLYLGKL